MKENDPWFLLRRGDTEKGLAEMRRAYAKDSGNPYILQLGAGYLFCSRYEDAWEHYRTVIEQYPGSISNFYGMAGVAKWCLGEPKEAVEQWLAGLEVKYSDTLGLGVTMPLLLFAASVLDPESFGTEEALQILREKIKGHKSCRLAGSGCFVVGWSNEFSRTQAKGGRRERGGNK